MYPHQLGAPRSVTLSDKESRQAFREHLDTNFSLIAPAGTGKTQAIAQRLAHLAEKIHLSKSPLAPHQIVVLSYTRFAAAQLQERVESELKKRGASQLLPLLNEVFFGTIHSFCLRLLSTWGHYLSLGPDLKQASLPDSALLENFLEQQQDLFGSSNARLAKSVSAFVHGGNILKKVGQLSENFHNLPPKPDALPPDLSLDSLLSVEEKGSKKTVENILNSKSLASDFLEHYRKEGHHAFPPECQGASKHLEIAWEKTFKHLWNWLDDSCLYLACVLGERFLAFRKQRGLLSYEDQINLTLQLLRHPQAGKKIKEKAYHILVDEAQDVDEKQFRIFFHLTSKEPCESSEETVLTPSCGSFSIVGDPQQAIFGTSENLAAYLRVHERFKKGAIGKVLLFSLTYRLPKAIVNFSNQVFPPILTPKPVPPLAHPQVDFVPLQAVDSSKVGAVRLLKMEMKNQEQSPIFLATYLKQHGHKGLGVKNWEEVALLCPRKNSLSEFELALRSVGLLTQNHSAVVDSPSSLPFRWMKALLRVWAFPQDAFQINGVLRELFGLSDVAIAHYVQTAHHALSLKKTPEGEGAVQKALSLLSDSAQRLRSCSASEAVEEAVKVIGLPQRLLALPNLSFDLVEDAMRQIREIAWQGQGMSLARFIQQWDLDEAAAAFQPLPDHLQLLTCQKAKGLEWPVVFLAGLFPRVGYQKKSYPLLEFGPSEGDMKWRGRSESLPEEARALEEISKYQQLERLAYVAATRAKQSLIFVDDSASFSKIPDKSFANAFQFTPSAANFPIWRSLDLLCPFPEHGKQPVDAKGEVAPAPHEEESFTCARSSAVLPNAAPAPHEEESFTCARSSAVLPNAAPAPHEEESFTFQFPERVLPSHLVEQQGAEASALNQAEEGASAEADPRAYGNTWHEVMRQGPWGRPNEWESYLEQELEKSNQAERLARECHRLFQSTLFLKLNEPGAHARREMPFLWQKQGVVIDGRLDLLGLLKEGTWVLVDWKTNRTEHPRSDLPQRYGGQLEMTALAVASMLEAQISSFFYATYAGEWVRHDKRRSFEALLALRPA